MDCSCCGSEDINDLDSTFDQNRAQKDAKRYLRKGLDKRSRKLIAYLTTRLSSEATILDIGCGAGGVHQELLREGLASHAVGVDASSAYLAAAEANAKELGLEEGVQYFRQDFALTAESVEAADLVVMDRVICCYPHLQQLLGQAAEKANRFLAVSFPFNNWWIRWPFRAVDVLLTLTGSGYHPFLHPWQKVIAVAEKAGLRLVHRDSHYMWRIMVFERM